jgi:hypothetical protein
MPSESNTPENPILVWALTKKGEIVATFFADLDEVEHYGKLNTDSGAWRTWDAFELPPDLDATRRVLVASHDKSKLVSATDKASTGRRYPILGNWSPAASLGGGDSVPASVHIDVPRSARPQAEDPQYTPPQHSRVRVLTDWSPIIPSDAAPPGSDTIPDRDSPPPQDESQTRSRRRIIPE